MKGPFTKVRHRGGAVSGTGVKVREGDLNSGKKQDGEVHRPGAVASAEGRSPPTQQGRSLANATISSSFAF